MAVAAAGSRGTETTRYPIICTEKIHLSGIVSQLLPPSALTSEGDPKDFIGLQVDVIDAGASMIGSSKVPAWLAECRKSGVGAPDKLDLPRTWLMFLLDGSLTKVTACTSWHGDAPGIGALLAVAEAGSRGTETTRYSIICTKKTHLSSIVPQLLPPSALTSKGDPKDFIGLVVYVIDPGASMIGSSKLPALLAECRKSGLGAPDKLDLPRTWLMFLLDGSLTKVTACTSWHGDAHGIGALLAVAEAGSRGTATTGYPRICTKKTHLFGIVSQPLPPSPLWPPSLPPGTSGQRRFTP